MKRAAILLAFLFLGCDDRLNTSASAESMACEVRTFEGHKFVVCRSVVYGGSTVALQPLDSCK
jgi:hypothetical protein